LSNGNDAITPLLAWGKCLISLQDYIQLETQCESYEFTLNLIPEVKQQKEKQGINNDITDRLYNIDVADVCLSVPSDGDEVTEETQASVQNAIGVSVVTRAQDAKNSSLHADTNDAPTTLLHPDILRREGAATFAVLQQQDTSLDNNCLYSPLINDITLLLF